MANSTQEIELLAAEIGENIYIDVAKWHLYLAEAHFHIPLAQKIFSLIEEDSLTRDELIKILRSISVPLGGGNLEVSLADLIPTQLVSELLDIIRDFQKKL
jgi:hypothetical protein